MTNETENFPGESQGSSILESWVNFVLIVDNEVAGNYKVPEIPGFEKMIAIFQSNPTIIENSEQIPEGYIWNGTSFNPPS